MKTCSQLGWLGLGGGTWEVCGHSRKKLPGFCKPKVSWYEAKADCESVGARLCTSAEVSNDEIKGTACGIERFHIWTATDDIMGGECEPGYAIAQARASTLLSHAPKTCFNKDLAEGYRSCCAEHAITCSSLGWQREGGSVSVCGTSSIDGCSGAKTYDQAQRYCRSAGARLCTSYEMMMNEPVDDGQCGIAEKYIWTSSDGCPVGEHMAQAGASSGYDAKPPTCMPNTASNVHAACCTNEYAGVEGMIQIGSLEDGAWDSHTQELFMNSLAEGLNDGKEDFDHAVVEITGYTDAVVGPRLLDNSRSVKIEYRVHLNGTSDEDIEQRSRIVVDDFLASGKAEETLLKSFEEDDIAPTLAAEQLNALSVAIRSMPSMSPSMAPSHPALALASASAGSSPIVVVALVGAVLAVLLVGAAMLVYTKYLSSMKGDLNQMKLQMQALASNHVSLGDETV